MESAEVRRRRETERGTLTEETEVIPRRFVGGDDDKKYTDADVNKILNKKFAEWEKKQAKKRISKRKSCQHDCRGATSLQSELDSRRRTTQRISKCCKRYTLRV